MVFSKNMNKEQTNKNLSVLMALSNYDGLPLNQISYRTNIHINELRPILEILIEDGYLRKERYAAHNYYCLNKETVTSIFNDDIAFFNVSNNLKELPPVNVNIPIRMARTCYGHLAGKLGVTFANHIVLEKFIEKNGVSYQLTSKGYDIFSSIIKDIFLLSKSEKFIDVCLDWTERRYHFSGVFGREISRKFFEYGWIKHFKGSRALKLTNKGKTGFFDLFNFLIVI